MLIAGSSTVERIIERMTSNGLLNNVSEWTDHNTGIQGSLGVSSRGGKIESVSMRISSWQ